MGNVVAELSAGHEAFVDHAPGLKGVSLVGRLFFSEPLVGQRLVRLGLLPRCPDSAAEAILTDVRQRRTPDQRAADKQAYERLVVVAKYAELLKFNRVNLRVMVLQALHLAETQQYATLASVAISATNSWTLHTVSGTNQGSKKTNKSYSASVEAYCAFGAEATSSLLDEVVVPIHRHVAVTFLEAEKGRERRTQRLRLEVCVPTGAAARLTPPASLIEPSPSRGRAPGQARAVHRSATVVAVVAPGSLPRVYPSLSDVQREDGEAGLGESDGEEPSAEDDEAEAIVAEVLNAAAGTAPPPPNVPSIAVSRTSVSQDLPVAVSARPAVAGGLDGGSGAPSRAASRPSPLPATPLLPSPARSAA